MLDWSGRSRSTSECAGRRRPGSGVRDSRSGPDSCARRVGRLVFAQEIPDEAWLDEWEQDYEVFIGEGRQYRTRSALLVRHPIVASRST